MSTEQSPGDQPASQPQDEPHPQPGGAAAADAAAAGASPPGPAQAGSAPHTGPSHPVTAGPTPPRGGDFFSWIRSLGITRGGDRWMGGVASGLAHRWGVDPVLIRGLFLVAAIFLGVGVLAYGILWLLLPEADGRIHAQEAAHGRWTAGMTGGLIVTILGLGGARAGFWFGEGGIGGAFWGLFWVAVVAFGIYSIVRGSRRRAAYRAGWHASQPVDPGAGSSAGASSGGADTVGSAAPFSGGVPASGDAYYAKPGAAPSYSSSAGYYASGQSASVPYYGGHGQQSAPPYYGGSLPPVPAPVRAPQPRVPRRRGPSAPFVLVVLGVAALVAGSLGVLVATGTIPLAAGAIWTSVAIVLGLGILVAGLRGRTAGILTLFAVVALVGGAVSQSVDRFSTFQAHTASYAPATVAQATAGYDITAAKGTLDLSALDATPLAGEAIIPVKVTMSDLTITVPKDVPVEVRSSATLADVKANGHTTAGITQRDTATYNSGKPGATLVVNLDATLSNVTITEER
ncbi:hypothetical protein SCMU_30360 [Sinomonas cyclohexanicum]|uniref:Phage shock protein PspC N-terminal domain-containing protein n=1 Tax=Sinomonas cyclohexanicum TaxID=322009 RepID=A0ABN6FKH5_SINCY|nr:PspC domain-containing protein [Corynebacterium cyclohexanicum]BCT77194.1 hypothetical protein SCMU_30360 [Corynebacterium cyclohexanicum]